MNHQVARLPLVVATVVTWNDTTRFADGKTAADLAVGAELEINGVVSGAAVSVTRIELEDDRDMPNPGPGIAIFETRVIASNVVKADGKLASFTVNGLAFTAATNIVVLEIDGPLVDGVKTRVLFKKTSTGNVALLVKTDN